MVGIHNLNRIWSHIHGHTHIATYIANIILSLGGEEGEVDDIST